MNQSNEPHTQLPKSGVSQKTAMQELAVLSMPIDTKAMLASVDDVLADAMQNIAHSLEQSSNQIDAAKRQLLQNHPGLQQAYNTYQASSQQVVEEQYQDDFMKDQLDYQRSALEQYRDVQIRAETTKETIGKALEAIENKLIAQQKAYEHQVLSTESNPQKAVPEEALLKDELPKEQRPNETLLKEEDASEQMLQHSNAKELSSQNNSLSNSPAQILSTELSIPEATMTDALNLESSKTAGEEK